MNDIVQCWNYSSSGSANCENKWKKKYIVLFYLRNLLNDRFLKYSSLFRCIRLKKKRGNWKCKMIYDTCRTPLIFEGNFIETLLWTNNSVSFSPVYFWGSSTKNRRLFERKAFFCGPWQQRFSPSSSKYSLLVRHTLLPLLEAAKLKRTTY